MMTDHDHDHDAKLFVSMKPPQMPKNSNSTTSAKAHAHVYLQNHHTWTTSPSPTRAQTATPVATTTTTTTTGAFVASSSSPAKPAFPLRHHKKLPEAHFQHPTIGSVTKPKPNDPRLVNINADQLLALKHNGIEPPKSVTKPIHVPPRPKSTGAFKPRKVEKTKFRYFYDRGDLPLRVNFAGAVRKIQWQVDLSQLDYAHYLPLFMEGLRELDEPYQFLALHGILDLLEKGQDRTLPCVSRMILPMKENLMTRHHHILCVQMKVLQKLVTSCPFAGEALVPYYRQLLSIFNLFITKRVNCGDAIDYGQRRQENLGDLIMDTLYLLEAHGGPDAFVNIKYMIPTYESCMQKI